MIEKKIEDLIYNLAQMCTAYNKQIATAESCTGGLAAKLMTDCAGSSRWFERGFVTYSNLAKEQMLGVDPQLITDCGAVSESVAEAMARGVLQHSAAHYALAITGVAGPGGGSKTKPVGTVCFAWAYYDCYTNKKKCISSTQYFSGDREAVRMQSAFFSLQTLSKIISENA